MDARCELPQSAASLVAVFAAQRLIGQDCQRKRLAVREHFLAGEEIPVTISADYYFGSPVSGGKVTWVASFHETSNRPPSQVLDAAGLGSSTLLFFGIGPKTLSSVRPMCARLVWAFGERDE